MDSSLSTILYIAFLALIGLLSLIAILAVYIYIRYGRNLSITLTSSAVFIALFVIGAIAALVTLQDLIAAYV